MRLLRFLGVISTVLLSVGFSAPESIQSSASLSKLLRVMSEIADEGPEMSFFGWIENAATGSRLQCQRASRDDAAQYLSGLADGMDWANPSQEKALNSVKKKGLDDFRFILRSDHLQRCEHSFSENMTFTRIVQFRNEDTGYNVQFTEGYED
jgi:hypothetical protein